MLASRWTSLWLSSPGKCPIGTPNGAAFEQEMSRKKCPGTGIGSSGWGDRLSDRLAVSVKGSTAMSMRRPPGRANTLTVHSEGR